ncbi:MAG: hypothetical protein PXX73_06300 [Sideroxydans sp.]|nr:hypothetical protein [Sideroxydans sp.]
MTEPIYPDDLPILTETLGGVAIPVLRQVAAPREFSEAQMQVLLQHFQAHLETVFSQKLNRHLEQLHHQAVKLAIAELKTELPDLLRNLIDSNQP